MGRLPHEYQLFVERLLREHPEKVEKYHMLEEMIIACCHGPDIVNVEQGGGKKMVSEPERIIIAKESNARYQALERQIGRIDRALGALKDDERLLAELMFFEGLRKREVAEAMEMDDKAVWRMKIRVLWKVASYVIGDWVDKRAE